MKWTLLIGIGILIAVSRPVAAQDLTPCTSQGYSVKCCSESVKRFGPFGTYKNNAERRRVADACMAASKKKKG